MLLFKRAEIDFEYNDQITLGMETQLILNWPKQAFAALPVSLLLSVVRFSGTVSNSSSDIQFKIYRYIANYHINNDLAYH